MSSADLSVCMQFFLIFNLIQTVNIYCKIFLCLEVGVSLAVLNRVANFFTAKTPHIPTLHFQDLLLFLLSLIFLFLFFVLVFAEFTPRHLFNSLATAPPHFSAPR
jgi:hypothetical protein